MAAILIIVCFARLPYTGIDRVGAESWDEDNGECNRGTQPTYQGRSFDTDDIPTGPLTSQSMTPALRTDAAEVRELNRFCIGGNATSWPTNTGKMADLRSLLL